MTDGLAEGESLPPPAIDGASATISFDAAEATCASLELNGVACVRAVVVEAHTRLAGTHLALSVDAHPACDIVRPVETIDAATTLAVDVENLRLPLSLLRASTERTHADIVARLVSPSGATIAHATHRIAIAPETHWSGMATHSESIAAFVTPNSPAIAELLRDASQRLARKTGSGSLDGYLSGSAERVQRIAESCYEALAARGISYVVLQASFEKEGQKVRTPADVFREQLANCLDLSVTLASLLEACGLWPMIVLGDGHATVAFATIDEHFADPVHEGPSRLENRRALGEARIIEATALCGDPKSFGDALGAGERWLRGLSDRSCVVDVRAARRAGFHPMPEAIARNERDADAPVEPPPATYDIVQPAGLPPLPPPILSPRERRLEQWKKKLLDLTLRNRLLNDRDAAGVSLVAEGDGTIALLEDILWDEKTLALRPKGAMREMSEAAMQEELRAGTLRANLDDAELFKRATKAYRDGRSSLEETGARSLYVALGMLEYRVEQRSEPVRAPLILVPVAMERISRSEGFRIRVVLDDTVPNVALVEYLRMTHGLDIQLGHGVAGQLTEDEKGLDLAAILARVRHAVKDVPGARVLAKAKLGNYSFKKLPLFEEMRLRGKTLSAHPIVASLLDRSAPATLRDAKLLDPAQVDAVAEFSSVRMPLAADSSQIAAVLSAAAGRTFVLQGPPGTGKSQTITNLLSECLARGKRVLFIAEKSAALEVVSERLKKCGLGAFALDLHADHATKTSFVSQVKQALEAIDARAASGAANFANTAANLDRTRLKMRLAGEALHGATADGPSAHDAIERTTELAERHAAGSGSVSVGLASSLAGKLAGVLPAKATARDLAERLDRVERLAATAAELSPAAAATLADFSPERALSPEESQRLAQAAAAAREAVTALAGPARELASALGLAAAPDLATLRAQCAVASLARSAFGAAASRFLPHTSLQARSSVPTDASPLHRVAASLANAALAPDHAVRLDALAHAIELVVAAQSARRAVALRFDLSVLDLPLVRILGDLRAARDRFVFFRWLAVRKVRGELVRLARVSVPSDSDDLIAQIEQLIDEKRRIDAAGLSKQAAEILAVWGDASSTSAVALDADAARRAIEAARAFARLARQSFPRDLTMLAARIPTTIEDGSIEIVSGVASEALARVDAALATLAELHACPAFDAPDSKLVGLESRLTGAASSAALLPSWSAFTTARRAASAVGLAPVAEALLAGTLSPAVAEAAAEAELLAAWTRDRLASEPALLDCGSDRMQELRRALVAGVAEYRKGASGAVALSVRDRARTTLADIEAPGMRQARMKIDELRALTTIRRPIRRVMSEAAPAIAAVKPIVLASPLSAATMLPADFPAFDLVVFDEASQVPVWDAACAISRGVASVIVGDSKQMPPTSFFDRKDSGEGEGDSAGAGAAGQGEAALADALEPLESVLEEAIASGIPQRSLLWHYRSLIIF